MAQRWPETPFIQKHNSFSITVTHRDRLLTISRTTRHRRSYKQLQLHRPFYIGLATSVEISMICKLQTFPYNSYLPLIVNNNN